MPQARLTNLARALRRAGLNVVEVPGWRDRSRPESTGGFAPVGVLWHHTGSKDVNPLSIEDDLQYAEWLAKIGRSDLPAPLCQLSIGRNGTVYVCAAGRGNHAGVAKAFGPVPAGDGNELYVGVECQNSGSEGWPGEQYEAMVKTGVVLAKILGTDERSQAGHRETSVTGKWDPGLLDLPDFRADIAEGLRPSTRPTRKAITVAVKLARKAGRNRAADRLRKIRDGLRP
jgi:hypothetical protein